jgi:adenylylsulfate kinase
MLAKKVAEKGIFYARLDGDDLRKGLCNNVGFDDAGRTENLRRAAEVAKLMAGSNIMTICSFITPKEAQRAMIRDIMGGIQFQLIGLNCSSEICAQRDVKGMYQQAKAGSLANFTGIDASFEAFESADLVLDTGRLREDEALEEIIRHLNGRIT